MFRKSKKRGPGRAAVVMLTCTLAVPTVPGILYGRDLFPTKEALLPYLITGALLGVMHLPVRPVLRLLSIPIGCLTLGLFGPVIDTGLIYLCFGLVPNCAHPGFLCVLLTALLINAVTAWLTRG